MGKRTIRRSYQFQCDECGNSVVVPKNHMEGTKCKGPCLGTMHLLRDYKRIPLRKRIKWALAHKKLPRTAQWFKSHPGIEPYAGLGTVSSLLKKMVDDGDLIGIDNYGPRGGRGYKLRKRR